MTAPAGGMFDHVGQPAARSNVTSVIDFKARALTTTSGTLSTATGAKFCPFLTITKTATKTGRYTVQVVNSRGIACGGFKRFLSYSVGVISVTADAALTTAKGIKWAIRNEDAQAGTFQIQFFVGDGTTDVYADAELEDGAAFTLDFSAHKSTAQG